MKASGRATSNTAKELINGSTALATTAITKTERNKDKGLTYGKTAPSTKGSGITT